MIEKKTRLSQYVENHKQKVELEKKGSGFTSYTIKRLRIHSHDIRTFL